MDVIHCKTQKEWDVVIKFCSPESRMFNSSKEFKEYYTKYPEGIAISIEDCSYCGLHYWKNEGRNIISYDLWESLLKTQGPEFPDKPEDYSPLIELLSKL